MKRLLAVCLTLCLLLCGIPAFADESPVALEDYVHTQLLKCEAVIDLSAYNLQPDDIKPVLTYVTEHDPLLFHVTNKYGYIEEKGKLKSIIPTYTMTGDSYEEAKRKIDRIAAQQLAILPSGASDYEKVILLHDYIVARYDYDLGYSNRDIFSFLTTGAGVCQAYTQWFKYLLDKIGIGCEYVVSTEMNHIWNIVKVDGEWYNVDLTYDDPSFVSSSSSIPGVTGYMRHSYFMLSTDAMPDDHFGGDYPYECTSAKYDGRKYADSYSSIVYLDGSFFTYNKEGIVRYDTQTDKYDVVYALDEKWRPWKDDMSFYSMKYSGMSTCGDFLIFNSFTQILSYLPSMGQFNVVYTYDKGDGNIFGSAVTGEDTVTLHISQGVNGAWKRTDVKINLPEKGDYDLPFTDTPKGKWYYNAVAYVVGKGLFNGVSKTLFKPDDPMNRAMLVSVLYRMEGSPSTVAYTMPFTDVPSKEYYYNAVKWAYANDIVKGVSAKQFGPNQNITREQMATILYRYTEFKRGDTKPRASYDSYPDAAKVSSYAKDAMQWAIAKGYITGNKIGNITYIQPQGSATRAQVATILMRYLESNTTK